MAEDLSSRGIYFDDLYVLRVLDPEITSETHDLRSESSEYIDKLKDFERIANEFIQISEKFAKEVDAQKMLAIGAKNLLKTISKQRQTEQKDLQVHMELLKKIRSWSKLERREEWAKILERKMELDRLKVEYHYLQRIISEQQEIITNFHES